MTLDLQGIDDLIRAVATETTMPYFRKLTSDDIAEKPPSFGEEENWVTVADKKTEIALAAGLQKMLPGSHILGEESFINEPGAMNVISSSTDIWIIDPIDGTTAFKNGKPGFGMMVALVRGGETVAGWVYHPVTDEMIKAEKGAGAWRGTDRLKVNPPSMPQNMNGVINTLALKRTNDDIVRQCKPHFHGVAGSRYCAFDYPGIAVGQINPDDPRKTLLQHDFLLCSTPFGTRMWPWDHAPGLLIAAETGAHIATWDGTPPDLRNLSRGILIAPDRPSWRYMHDKLAALDLF